MKRKRLRIILMIISLGVILLLSALLISFQFFFPTEPSDIEYSSEVSRVDVLEAEENTYINVFISEPRGQLIIMQGIIEHIDTTRIKQLKAGDEIFFRIPAYAQAGFAADHVTWIVSLRIGDDVIFTVEDYHLFQDAGWRTSINAVFVFIFASMIVFLYCVFSLIWGKYAAKKNQ